MEIIFETEVESPRLTGLKGFRCVQRANISRGENQNQLASVGDDEKILSSCCKVFKGESGLLCRLPNRLLLNRGLPINKLLQCLFSSRDVPIF